MQRLSPRYTIIKIDVFQVPTKEKKIVYQFRVSGHNIKKIEKNDCLLNFQFDGYYQLM